LVDSLSFVFPMYNEEENIERMVAATLAVAPKLAKRYELVIVDDASSDGCGKIADRLAVEHPEVRVIHHEVNRKLGGTLRTGFKAAKNDWILYIDSDLPIDMGSVPPAFSLTANADMVIGYRMNRNEGLRRAVMSWCYNRLIRLLFGLRVRDVNFSFKLFRRKILDEVRLFSEGSFIDAELLIETARRGYRIREHGFMYYPRTKGESTLAGPGIVMKILAEMNGYRRRRKPVTRVEPEAEPARR